MKTELLFLIIIILSSIILVKPNTEWDEYVYLMNAKYFSGDMIYFENIRPPMLPLIISGFYLFGIEKAIFPIIPFLLLGFFLISIYLLSRDFKALIIMFCFPIFLMYSQKLMTEILGASFVMLSIFFMKNYFEKKKGLFFYLSYLFSGLAFLSRYPLGVSVAAITLLYIVFEKRKNYLKLLTGLAVFCLPIILWVNYIGISSFFMAISYVSNDSGFFYYFINIFTIFGISGLFLLFIKSYKYEKKDLFFLIPLAVLFLTLQFMTHKEPRYLIPILPFAAMLFSKFMKFNIIFVLLVLVFLLFSFYYSMFFYGVICEVDDNLQMVSEFFLDKQGAIILSNYWPAVSYYSNNPSFAISEPCNVKQRVLETNASYIVVSSFNPCFETDYSEYILAKVINESSCETVNVYKI